MYDLEILSWGKKLKLARSEETSADILTQLIRESSHTLRKLVAENPNTPIEVLEILGEDYADEITNNPVFDLLLIENSSNIFLKVCLACSSTTSAEILEKLSCDSDCLIRSKVAENTNISEYLLAKLAADEDCHVAKYVLKNINVSLDVLKILVANGYYGDKIIKHPQSTAEILYLLLDKFERKNRVGKYTCQRTNATIARYRKTPLDILSRLANSEIGSVRRGVAENRNTPIDLLIKLSSDNATSVIRAVARNPQTSSSLLIKLASHLDKSVRSAVACNQKTPTEELTKLSIDSEKSVRSAVARNFNTPVDTLIKLANDPEQEIGVALCKNFSTPITVLNQLLEKSPDYIYIIIRNYKIVADSFIELISDNKSTKYNRHYSDNKKIISNEINARQIIKLFKQGRYSYPNSRGRLVVQIVDLTPNFVRCQMIGNPHLPKSILDILSNYQSSSVRKLVGRNPNTSSKTLAKLAQDPIESVRKSVIKNKNTPSQSLVALTKNVESYSLRKAVKKDDIKEPDVLRSCLEKLATSSDWLDRKLAAKHKNTPITVLQKLASDDCKYVRIEAAKNINLSPNVLERLENLKGTH